jgi:hypothetical protein
MVVLLVQGQDWQVVKVLARVVVVLLAWLVVRARVLDWLVVQLLAWLAVLLLAWLVVLQVTWVVVKLLAWLEV